MEIIRPVEGLGFKVIGKQCDCCKRDWRSYRSFDEELELFEFKTVVEGTPADDTQIGLADARAHDPDVQMDDQIGLKLDTSGFGRIAAQTAKQVIIQKIREAERDVIFTEFGLFPNGCYNHSRVVAPLTTPGYSVTVISTPRGTDTTSGKTDAPVVVKPETDSKSAATNDGKVWHKR